MHKVSILRYITQRKKRINKQISFLLHSFETCFVFPFLVFTRALNPILLYGKQQNDVSFVGIRIFYYICTRNKKKSYSDECNDINA